MRDESRIGRVRRRRGVDAELKARKTLELDGWLVVRAAGSKGPFDLIALKQRGHETLVRCIQVKRGAVEVGAELVKMAQLPNSELVSLELWLYQPRRPWDVRRLITSWPLDREAASSALSERPTRSGASG